MWMKLWRESGKAIVLTLFSILLAAGYLHYFYFPLQNILTTSKNKEASIRISISMITELQGEYNQITAKQRELQEKHHDYAMILPGNLQLYTILKQISEIAERNQVCITSISPYAITRNNNENDSNTKAMQYRFVLNVNGSFTQISKMLLEMENQKQLILVKDILLKKVEGLKDNSQVLTSQIAFIVYGYNWGDTVDKGK